MLGNIRKFDPPWLNKQILEPGNSHFSNFSPKTMQICVWVWLLDSIDFWNQLAKRKRVTKVPSVYSRLDWKHSVYDKTCDCCCYCCARFARFVEKELFSQIDNWNTMWPLLSGHRFFSIHPVHVSMSLPINPMLHHTFLHDVSLIPNHIQSSIKFNQHIKNCCNSKFNLNFMISEPHTMNWKRIVEPTCAAFWTIWSQFCQRIKNLHAIPLFRCWPELVITLRYVVVIVFAQNLTKFV